MARLPVSGSLRNQLVVSLIGGAALLALLLFLVTRNFAAQVAQEGQDSILGAAAASILDAAAIHDGQVEIDLPYASFSMLANASDDRVFYAIYRDDTFLSGYDGLDAPANQSDGQPTFQSTEFNGADVRVVTDTRTLIGADDRTQIRIVLAQTQDQLAGTLERISRNAALLGAGFFALAALLSFWATSTTIGQLKTLTQSVTRRGPQDLSAFRKPVPTEMAPLVTSLNSLMGRLDQSLRQSEDFIAEAAHRVRTPLATVRAHAEATLQRVDKAENRQALRAMVRAIDESSRAASQLLDHAMITVRADHLTLQDVDLAELVGDLVQRLTPVADMKDLDLAFQAEWAVPILGDPVQIQNAVRNLIDNALKYAPPESTVEIAVWRGPRPNVTIQDRGPGFPLHEMDTLTARFKRGRNAEGTIGSGLGLTIAHDVAAAHDGALTLENREGGGACVCLSF